MKSVGKGIGGLMVFLAMLPGSAEARDMTREVASVERAAAGKYTTISFTSETRLPSVTIRK